MARRASDQGRDRFGEIATAAHVTVRAVPRGPTLRQRAVGARVFLTAGGILCAVVVAVGLGVFVAGAATGVQPPRARVGFVAAAVPAPTAPREPPYCVSLGILLHDSRFANAGFDRSIVCGPKPAHRAGDTYVASATEGCRRLGAPAPGQCFDPHP